MPVVQSETAGTVDGKRVRTVTAVSNNATTGGQVRLVQHFDEGTWIVRRFEITVSAGGKVSATITGFLRDDKRGPVAFGTFQLPSEVSQKYRRVQTGSPG
jgi:outer membrane lipoprotein-sorting protein